MEFRKIDDVSVHTRPDGSSRMPGWLPNQFSQKLPQVYNKINNNNVHDRDKFDYTRNPTE